MENLVTISIKYYGSDSQLLSNLNQKYMKLCLVLWESSSWFCEPPGKNFNYHDAILLVIWWTVPDECHHSAISTKVPDKQVKYCQPINTLEKTKEPWLLPCGLEDLNSFFLANSRATWSYLVNRCCFKFLIWMVCNAAALHNEMSVFLEFALYTFTMLTLKSFALAKLRLKIMNLIMR